MSKYDEDIVSAAADIQEDGVLATLSRTTGGTKDAATGVTTGETTQTQSVYVVKLIAAGGKIQALDNIPVRGTSIERNTAYLIMAALKSDGSALDFYPEFDHQITIDSIVWKLSGVSALEPDGVPIIFKVAIRR